MLFGSVAGGALWLWIKYKYLMPHRKVAASRRYGLRTLLIALALGPPVLAGVWQYPKWMVAAFFVFGGYVACLFAFNALVRRREKIEAEK
jgi:hypothetical protein